MHSAEIEKLRVRLGAADQRGEHWREAARHKEARLKDLHERIEALKRIASQRKRSNLSPRVLK